MTALRWRVLKSGERSGPWNMACDEMLLSRGSREGGRTGILRFYAWRPAAITLGHHQRPEAVLDLAACLRDGIDWVRRPTGGRAVLHERELTYSLIVPQECLPAGVVESYRVLSRGLSIGLRRLGLPAEWAVGRRKKHRTDLCFDAPSWYELVIDGKKVIGSAQARKNGLILQHGSIPLFTEPAKLAFYLSVFPEAKRVRLYRWAARQSACLARWLGDRIRVDELADAFLEGFRSALGGDWYEDALTPEEERLIAERVATRVETENGRKDDGTCSI